MKKIKILSYILFIASLIVSCSKSDKPRDISPSQVFLLTDEEIVKLEKEALKGSGDSAFELWKHYGVDRGDSDADSKKSIYWLKIAAKNGHVIAQYNLAYISFYESPQNISDAKYWAKKAALQGDKDAVVLLKEIEAYGKSK